MVTVNSSSPIRVSIKAIGRRTKFTAMVSSTGLITVTTKVIGLVQSFMVVVSTPGLMGALMMVNMLMTKKAGKEHTHGLMARDIKELG